MPNEIETIESLRAAGCTRSEIDEIIECIRSGNLKGFEKLIERSRKNQLNRLHKCQKCIDRLDFLRYQLKADDRRSN